MWGALGLPHLSTSSANECHALASKKQPVSKIVELAPGAIIQFNKSCDEMLDLEVSGLRIAEGECVKVGDKFGLRITSIILPEERQKPAAAQSRLID